MTKCYWRNSQSIAKFKTYSRFQTRGREELAGQSRLEGAIEEKDKVGAAPRECCFAVERLYVWNILQCIKLCMRM